MTSCSRCEAAGTAGWEPFIDEKGVRRLRRCQCFWRAKQSWANGVPDKYRQASFETYKPMKGNKDAIDVAKAWAHGTRDLYLAGGVGAGKTLLACCILNAVWQTEFSGAFVRVAKLLLDMQPSLSDDKTSSALWKRVTSEKYLVVDDIGAERDQASDYTRRTLLTLYETRVDSGLRTIFTSNYPLSHDLVESKKTLGEFLDDDRLPSRIAGQSDVVWIACGDQRMKRRGANSTDS